MQTQTTLLRFRGQLHSNLSFGPQMTNLNAVIPILMHLFIFSFEKKKMYYLHKATSGVSCVKPNASQWEATLRDDVGFPTVYRRIYRRIFFLLYSIRRRVTYASALESWFSLAKGYITKTCLYNFDPLKPHFCIVKLGFTGVDIIFLISAQNIDCGHSLEPPRWGGSNEYYTRCFEQK